MSRRCATPARGAIQEQNTSFTRKATNVQRKLASILAIPAALVLTATISSCGSTNEQPSSSDSKTDSSKTSDSAGKSDSGSSLSGTLAGAGASSQEAAVAGWTKGFQTANPDVTVNYAAVGSGSGRKQFLAGSVAFAGSDAYLKTEEVEKAKAVCGDVIEVPAYISPIAVTYNLEGVEDLQLSPSTIAKIFNQKIKTWDDAAIKADNPDAELPSDKITVVNRSDESGTTENFVEYLKAAAGSDWPHEVSGEWPVEGGTAAKGTSGVVKTIKAAKGAIGYADASRTKGLGVAKVKVGDEFVKLTSEAAAKVVDASDQVSDRGDYDFAIDLKRDTDESGAYPIVLVSYSLACTEYKDKETAELVKAWLTYVTSEEGQKAAAEAAGSAPISDALRTKAMKAVKAISSK